MVYGSRRPRRSRGRDRLSHGCESLPFTFDLLPLAFYAWPGRLGLPGNWHISYFPIDESPKRVRSELAEALSLEDAERVFIERVLARHGGDVRLAAGQLGMSRSALYRRLQQYGVRD